jgi:hypothetical protein
MLKLTDVASVIKLRNNQSGGFGGNSCVSLIEPVSGHRLLKSQDLRVFSPTGEGNVICPGWQREGSGIVVVWDRPLLVKVNKPLIDVFVGATEDAPAPILGKAATNLEPDRRVLLIGLDNHGPMNGEGR